MKGEKVTLAGVFSKIERAKAHAECLQRQSEPLFDPQPNPVRGEIRPGGREHLYWWKNPPALNPNTEVILGDCLHNLRSALDHLARQLVLLNGRHPGDNIAFPIRQARPHIGHPLFWTADITVQIPGALAEAQPLVEEVQPYNGGKIGSALLDLRDLDNWDKHRHLLVTLAAIDYGQTSWFEESPSAPPNPFDVLFLPGPVEDGQPAAKVTYPEPYYELDPQLRFRLGVRLDKRLGRRFALKPLRVVLGNLIWTVEDEIIHSRFKRFFA